MAGATGVFWLTDPVVGDKLAVVTALPPLKGATQKRTFVGGALLTTAQGLAVESVVDGLTVTASRDVVRIGRPNGLALGATGSFVCLKIAGALCGLRPDAEQEENGLDLSMHGEEGYNLDA